MRGLRRLPAPLRLGDFSGDTLLVGAALVQGGIARFHLGADLLELRADLLAALAVALLRLQRLQLFDLRVVVGLLARADLLASGLQRRVALGKLRFEAFQLLWAAARRRRGRSGALPGSRSRPAA
jgi:hypothetical protein